MIEEGTLPGVVAPRPGRGLSSLRGSDGMVDLRRLKVLSVAVPAGFMIAVEWLWFTLERDPFLSVVGYVARGAGSLLPVAGFAALMFHFIDRAQRQVLRQNRQLSAANAVAAAVRGEGVVADIADAALRCMLGVSGAVEATIELTGAYAGAPDDAGTSRCRWDVTSDGFADPSGPSIEVPLSSSTAPVGRMTLRLPLGATERDSLAPHTLRSIGLQVGSAIQIAHLIEYMHQRKDEGHGFYDVLMRISNQNPLPDVLAAVVRHARELLQADESALCLQDEAVRLMSADSTSRNGHGPATGLSCLTSGGETHHLHTRTTDCPSRSSHDWAATLAVPVGSAGSPLGELWVGRRTGGEFGERARSFLEALSGLASIGIASARVRESESQQAILVERDRIAREMHDSLAQALGAAHLRLRVLDSRAEGGCTPRELSGELVLLADMCEEAYRDVREAILGLRESSRSDRGLLGNLQVYLEKYSQQSGIDSALCCSLDHPLELPPPTEVQVIRVIQEAMTNVRKHAAARSLTVRIDEDSHATTFTVEDDGCGFDPRSHRYEHDGFGMSTMRERIQTLGGSLTIDSAPGRGTRVIAMVPTGPVDRFAKVDGSHG